MHCVKNKTLKSKSKSELKSEINMEKKATTTKVKRTTGKKQSQKKLPTAMPTLLQAIERVVELSKDSQLSDDFMQQASPEIGLISDSYGISDVQAVLFCVCMERGPRRVPATSMHWCTDDCCAIAMRRKRTISTCLCPSSVR